MSETPRNGQPIEQEMRKIRHELEEDAEHLADSARNLGKWREYVRAYPWLAVGGAAALGFLLTPTRCSHSHSASSNNAASTGSSFAGLIATGLGRAAVAYVAKAAMDYVADSNQSTDTSDQWEEMP